MLDSTAGCHSGPVLCRLDRACDRCRSDRGGHLFHATRPPRRMCLREVERAVSKRRPLISLRIDLAPLPAALEYFLNTSQWLDASNGGIECSLPRLTDAVRRTSGCGRRAIRRTGRPRYAAGEQRTAFTGRTASEATDEAWRCSRSVLWRFSVLGYFALDALWLSKRIDRTPARESCHTQCPEKLHRRSSVRGHEREERPGILLGWYGRGAHRAAWQRRRACTVIARTSSFSFKGKSDDIPTIAATPQSLERARGQRSYAPGDRLRVTTQLVRTDSGRATLVRDPSSMNSRMSFKPPG